MKALSLDNSQELLEYGAGDAQIALACARMGCRVSVIDVEPKYLDLIRDQANAFGIKVDTMKGVFGENFPDTRKYDCILFFEAFHHALNHQDVLTKIRAMLKPGGRIVFGGEPIIEPDSAYAHAVPYPWGPRLDGLSARAMRVYGWCELGFQRAYFIELMLRNGFRVEYVHCPLDGRGSCYVAHLLENGELNLGQSMLLSTYDDSEAGWHNAEAEHRWTKERAVLPLAIGYHTAMLRLSNPLPVPKRVTLSSPGGLKDIVLDPFSDANVEIKVPLEGGRLIIEVNTHRPCDILASNDGRDLGIMVKSVLYS
jgi:SAM-dependent methyltransferase